MQIAAERAQIEATSRGRDVFRCEHQLCARPCSKRRGGCQFSGQRIHAELVGVLQTNLTATIGDRDLTGKIVQVTEKRDVAAAAGDFGGGGINDRTRTLNDPHAFQNQVKTCRINIIGTQIEQTARGFDITGRTHCDITDECHAWRTSTALIFERQCACGGEDAQVIDIGLGQANGPSITGQRTG